MTSSSQGSKSKGSLSLTLIEVLGQALFWIGLGIFLANLFPFVSEKVGGMIGAVGVFLGIFARKIRDYYATE